MTQTPSLLPSFKSLFSIPDNTQSCPLNTLQPTRSSNNLQDLSSSHLRLASRDSIPLTNLLSQRSINLMDQEAPKKTKSPMIVPFTSTFCFQAENDQGAELNSMYTEQQSDPIAPLLLVRRNNSNGLKGNASFFATMMETYTVEQEQDLDTTGESSHEDVAEVGFGFDVESIGDDF